MTQRQAQQVLAALTARMADVGLRLHPDKTRIVYCKDGDRRREQHEHTSFTFLGFTFTLRQARGKHGLFSSFMPAASRQALAEMGQRVRRWRLHRWVQRDLAEIAAQINPIVAGWINYYGRFYPSRIVPLLQRINTYLMRWAGMKYKRLRSYKRFKAWWFGIIDRDPDLFAHWRMVRTFAGLR